MGTRYNSSYSPTCSGRDQPQSLHYLAHRFNTPIEIHCSKDRFNRRRHSDWRDVVALRWVATDESIQSVKSTDVIEVGI